MVFDKTTYPVVFGSLSSPWWLPWLKSISDIAALLLPIAALVWLGVQISAKLWGKK